MTEKTVEELERELAEIKGAGVVTVKDNRYRLVIDAKQLESWELAAIEAGVVGDWLIIFSRYLENGSGPVSPELSQIEKKPVRKLTAVELDTYRNSKAFDIVERQTLTQLKAMAGQFGDALSAGF
jgi:hypothetical protein